MRRARVVARAGGVGAPALPSDVAQAKVKQERGDARLIRRFLAAKRAAADAEAAYKLLYGELFGRVEADGFSGKSLKGRRTLQATARARAWFVEQNHPVADKAGLAACRLAGHFEVNPNPRNHLHAEAF